MLEWANVTNRDLTRALPLRRSFGDQCLRCVLMRTPADAWRPGHGGSTRPHHGSQSRHRREGERVIGS
jgi:hypothetical protein